MAETSQADCWPQILILPLSLTTVFRYSPHAALCCRLPQTDANFPALVTGVCVSPRTKVRGFETEVTIVLWQMHSPESLNVLYNNKSSYWTVGCYGKGSRGADLRHSM